MDSQVVDFEWACSGECNQCSRLNYSAEDDLLTWNIMILILSATVCYLWMMGSIVSPSRQLIFHNPVHSDSVLQIPRCVPRAPTSGDVRLTRHGGNAIGKSCWSKKVASLTCVWGTEVGKIHQAKELFGTTTVPKGWSSARAAPVLAVSRNEKSSGRVSLNIKLGLKLTVP